MPEIIRSISTNGFGRSRRTECSSTSGIRVESLPLHTARGESSGDVFGVRVTTRQSRTDCSSPSSSSARRWRATRTRRGRGGAPSTGSRDSGLPTRLGNSPRSSSRPVPYPARQRKMRSTLPLQRITEDLQRQERASETPVVRRPPRKPAVMPKGSST